MAIIAALHDPLAVLLTDDLADVVTPHDDGTHRRAARVAAIVSPRSGKVVLRTRIAPNLRSHVPAAPRGWPAGVRVPLRIVVMIVVPNMSSCFGVRRERAEQNHSSHDFTHT